MSGHGPRASRGGAEERECDLKRPFSLGKLILLGVADERSCGVTVLNLLTVLRQRYKQRLSASVRYNSKHRLESLLGRGDFMPERSGNKLGVPALSNRKDGPVLLQRIQGRWLSSCCDV